MPDGNVRVANLKILFERAKNFEAATFKGLFNFINFIDKLKLNSGDLGAAKLIGENEDFNAFPIKKKLELIKKYADMCNE